MPVFAAARYDAVDSHTEGMPTRVIVDGIGELPGNTMLERKLRLEREHDEIRQLLMNEPRGHGAMSGAILQRPCRDDADWGVVFVEVSGYLPMCGHGTIGVATVLVETERVAVTEPETIVRLDVPAGLVEARVQVSDGKATSVTIRNVPAFVHALDGEADGVRYDMAFGGNFYAIADAASVGLRVAPESAPALIAAGLKLMAALPEPVHPENEAIRGCHHVIWTDDPDPGSDRAHRVDGRAATAIHPGWVDRSPCGTGTSARMAQRHARGLLELGAPFVHESIIGTRFTGRLVGETTVGGRQAVIPEISGRAWITGMGSYLLDPTDPFPSGFRIG
ncbi:MAG TPA: proline racemase family protein [Solirubrobacteraceae bacterium]|nr:proline racemase family protein [Solirubrobacteraceae bacterium]